MIRRVYDVYSDPLLVNELLILGRREPNWLYAHVHSLDSNSDGSYGQFSVQPRVGRSELGPAMRAFTRITEAENSVIQGGEWLGALAISKWLAHGPKIARPPIDMCEALIQVEVRLKLKDVHLPFPEMLEVTGGCSRAESVGVNGSGFSSLLSWSGETCLPETYPTPEQPTSNPRS